LSLGDGSIYNKNDIDRPAKVMMTQSRKDCRVAAFEGEVAAVEEEVDDGDEGPELVEDGGRVERVGAVMAPESIEVVETVLGCADSTEGGTGIVDVNSATGEPNVPII
jgi:hypothetical protein